MAKKNRLNLDRFWADGEPSSQNKEDCIEVQPDGTWLDRECSLERPFVCEIDIDQCPQGFEPFRDKCIYVGDEPKTLSEAISECLEYGSTTIVIEDEVENDFVLSFMDDNTDAWLGLYHGAHKGDKFGWLNGEISKWFNWDVVPEKYNPEYDCAKITPTGEWSNVDCEESNVPACQVYGATKPLSLRCPNGYDYWVGKCYKVYDMEMTQKEAEQWCRTEDGADLVYINNDWEDTMLREMMSSQGISGDAWIGLRSIPCKEKFMWSKGGFGKDFSAWAEGEPVNDYVEQACVDMSVETGQWAIEDCETKLPFMCKWSANSR